MNYSDELLRRNNLCKYAYYLPGCVLCVYVHTTHHPRRSETPQFRRLSAPRGEQRAETIVRLNVYTHVTANVRHVDDSRTTRPLSTICGQRCELSDIQKH